MNWFAAQRLMATARNPEKGKPIGNNTRLYFYDAGGAHKIGVWRHENYYNIRLHGNQIMQIYRDRIVPTDGGWRTVTTKARLNKYLPRGFRVFQKNFEWFIENTWIDWIDEQLIYPFDDVYYIHNEEGVMLYSTHPKYPQVYKDKGEEE